MSEEAENLPGPAAQNPVIQEPPEHILAQLQNPPEVSKIEQN